MNLLSFCYTGTAKTFSFMSSVSTVMGSAFKGQAKITETPIGDDPRSPTNTGYAQSKYVVERVTQHYASALSMPVRLLRVGQLCGHSGLGVWNTTEMWPILIETGLDHLQAMPTLSSKAINWLAVDICAQSAARVLMAPSLPAYTVTNLTNPSLVSWMALVDMVAEASGKAFDRIPMGEWVARLEKLAEEERADVPGLKLLGFFQEMAKNDTGGGSVVEIVSESVVGAEAINTATVDKWLASWRKDGFVKS
jgi:thioester reductase-like protein